jgi:hypothetical protein
VRAKWPPTPRFFRAATPPPPNQESDATVEGPARVVEGAVQTPKEKKRWWNRLRRSGP